MAMRESNWIWKNGELLPWHEATTHVLTHAIHYGSSVFEGMRSYATSNGPMIFRGRDHLRRLEHSARIYRIDLPWKAEQIHTACRELLQANELTSAYIRPIAYCGYGSLGLVPLDVPTDVVVAAIEWGAYLGEEALEQGLDVAVSSWRRIGSHMIPSSAKAGGNYLSSRLVGQEARRHGYGEGICLDEHGYLAEGAAENIFLLIDGTLFTPPNTGALLPGITRDTLVQIARREGFDVVEKQMPRDALYAAEEIFLTGTAAEVVPVRSVDGLTVGSGRRGPVTECLQSRFYGLFTGDTPDPDGWLEPVGELEACLT